MFNLIKFADIRKDKANSKLYYKQKPLSSKVTIHIPPYLRIKPYHLPVVFYVLY